MSSQFAVAPQAPGSLGDDIPAPELMAYLQALGSWRDRRRGELDLLDEASLRAPDRDALTGDVLLSMALWKSVAERHDLILATWDSGRVLPADRRRISTLIWGRLDHKAGEGNAFAVSLPEACRLSDSLASSLRARLHLEGSEPDVARRIRDLRAAVERIRDLVADLPRPRRSTAQGILVDLDRRLVDVTERARRGADVGGLLGPLDLDTAKAERDLIVGAATRTRTRDEQVRALESVEDLAARGQAVQRLAATCIAQVHPAPRFAVPDVTALGEPPAEPEALTAYLSKLANVARALDVAHSAYAGALERRDELAEQIKAAVPSLADLGAGPQEDAAEILRRAHGVLAAQPTDLVRLSALAAAARAYLSAAGGH
ncbi:hypothetical protein [Gephyromycinifex aptenodytis]|uniref:hypothetical protein n=1 Tax=Gephyromycinifex aptenodytis TaxID=2716227 RepID=UPI001448908D|nr:hypothetical protein [Gephyromycinifex aptenodytis]